MTPRLVPHTWLRYVFPGLVTGLAALWGWYVGLLLVGALGALRRWRASGEPGTGSLVSFDLQALMVLTVVVAAVAAAQVLLEGRFERTRLRGRIVGAFLAAWFAGLCMLLLGTLDVYLLAQLDPLGGYSFRLSRRLGLWALAGLSLAVGPVVVRLGRHLLEWGQARWDLRFLPPPPPPSARHRDVFGLHVAAGPVAGLWAGVVAYLLGRSSLDPFLGIAVGMWLLGAVGGGLPWWIPERLYQGWVRVVRGARPGWRVPLEPATVALSERFVGHFPSGLDIHLPRTDGVAELHASILAPEDGRWAVRGLSQRPVEVRRPLERVGLAFDPAQPAPFQTRLAHNDRVTLEGGAEVELVVLSREGTP